MPSMHAGTGQPVPTSRSEKRHTALLVTIERWQRKLEKADKTVRRAVLTITKLERQRRRLQKKIAADEAAKANGHVLAAVTAEPEPVTVKAKPFDAEEAFSIAVAEAFSTPATVAAEPLDIPPFLRRDGKAPKRKRATKAK